MDKKRICFVQVGFDFDGAVYLPTAAGAIAAYSMANEYVRSSYLFSDFIFQRENTDTAIQKIGSAYMVAFSCSVWNMQYNKALAKAVKKVSPQTVIVFGGHSISPEFDLPACKDFVDVLMFGEGEEVFPVLLKQLESGELSKVPNIAFLKNGEMYQTPRQYYSDLSAYPSPYLNGIFDRILAENPKTEFLAVLETNRGCPYHCAYCDWCAGKKSRLFPMERVKKEILWLAKNKIEYCFCADSNFGMFERDKEIADFLVETKKNYGYPKVFRPCYEKNSDERVFEICKALNSVGMDKGATMAYQTLAPQALENIGRKNLTMEHFSSLMKRYHAQAIPTYSELILGLPGETKESFCHGICTLLESGQHNSLSVYHCEMLPNSEMAQKQYREKHKIEVIKVAFNHIHSAINRDEPIQEYSYLVRSTETMSREDWVQANLFSVCVQCFHSLGLLRFVSMYLHEEKRISYYDFYSSLLDHILHRAKGKIHALWLRFYEKYEKSLNGDWNYHSEKLGNVTWFFEEGAFLEIISDYDAGMEELSDFIEAYDIPIQHKQQLLSYQKAVLRMPGIKKTELKLSYDFRSYFEKIEQGKTATLQKAENRTTFCSAMVYDTLPEYGRNCVWYGRRRGATVLKGDEVTVNLLT